MSTAPASAAPPGEGLAGALFRLAVAGLGLPPAAAWAATPREVLLAAAPAGRADGAGGGPPSRAAFAALCARYPDRPPVAAAGPACDVGDQAAGPPVRQTGQRGGIDAEEERR